MNSPPRIPLGHTTLNDESAWSQRNGVDLEEPIFAGSAFSSNPTARRNRHRLVLEYASSTLSQEVDLEVVDSAATLPVRCSRSADWTSFR